MRTNLTNQKKICPCSRWRRPPVVISSDEEVEGGNSEKEEKEEVDNENDVFQLSVVRPYKKTKHE